MKIQPWHLAVGLGMLVVLAVFFRIGYIYALHQIGNAMCHGRNAVGGYMYLKDVSGFKQLILRCYYLKPNYLEQREVVLGWLEEKSG